MEAHLVEGIKVPGESVSSASSLHWCHQAAGCFPKLKGLLPALHAPLF